MQNYYEESKGSANVEIIAVNLTTAERGGLVGIEKFVDAYGLTFPIPTTYMINTDGTIKQKIIGPMDEKTINELVNNLD